MLIFLVFYAVLQIVIGTQIDMTISNSYQRALAAGFTANIISEELVNMTSLGDFTQKFIDGHAHYKIFSGLADWEPLQVILLTIVFLFFGVSYWSMMIVPLIMSLLVLWMVYRLASDIYDEKTGFLAAIFAGFGTLFFYEAAVPMLENGVALFTLLCIYQFNRYCKKENAKHLYWLAVFLALGVLFKRQVLLIVPVLLIVFLIKKDFVSWIARKKVITSLVVSLALFFLVLTPLIAREIVFVNFGVSTLLGRSATNLENFYGSSEQRSGFITAEDLEFSYALPAYKKDLIMNRYDLSKLQKAVVVITSVFLNWILLPFILLGVFWRKKWFESKSYSIVELCIVFYALVNFVIFVFHGLIPRYMIPVTVLLSVFAARGVFMLPKKAIFSVAVLVILLVAGQTGLFLFTIANNNHIQSMQHDYEGAIKFMLDNTKGDFTVITSRQYQMAFFFLKNDKEKRVYVELLPEKEELLKEVIKTGFNKPEFSTGSFSYPKNRPSVRYIVVHERLETGPLSDIADYDARVFLDSYPRAKLDKILVGTLPNSKTWIYKVE